jgi:acyl-coenzyme A thioesterase PaaI-like protein
MVTWPKVSINTERDLSMCFGCGQSNPAGLKLNFRWDGKTAQAEFTPSKIYQGWPGMVHGGIIICLLDEAMAYAARFAGTDCVTAKIQAVLRRLASIDEPLIITSLVTKKTRKLVSTKARVSLTDGTLIAEGTATQFIINASSKEGQAKK